MASTITLSRIQEARSRAEGFVVVTPVMESRSISNLVGREIRLKAESLQRTGSFKVRGAFNALALLSDEQSTLGVVAASAGNHAQGVALAAHHLGISATVFMPAAASIPKVAATRGYGADVRLEGEDLGEAVTAAREFSESTGARFIHPYDDPDIIAGQGTLGLELSEQVPEPATYVLPIGGGGLISGSAAAIKATQPGAHIVGVHATAVPTYLRSRESGTPTTVAVLPTVADGIAVGQPSQIAFDLIERYVDEIVTVDDAPATEAVALLLERAKLLVEPSGAITVAALLEGKVDGPGVAIPVLSGGNIDLLLLDALVRHGQESRGRFGAFKVHLPDQPGQLAEVLATIGSAGANVLSVDHHREGTGLPYGLVGIQISIATRSHQHQQEIRALLEDQGVSPISVTPSKPPSPT